MDRHQQQANRKANQARETARDNDAALHRLRFRFTQEIYAMHRYIYRTTGEVPAREMMIEGVRLK